MTKTQIWLAAFLGVFFVLLALGRIFKSEDEGKSNAPENMMSQEQTSQQNELSPIELLNKLGCTSCHGANLAGASNGPALSGLKSVWTRENLISYLRNPSSFMDSDRFKEFRQKYPNNMMPAFNNADIKELGKIVDFLLNK